MGPVAMGFGLTRKKVYNHLRLMTCQALGYKHSEEGKLVSKVFHPSAIIELIITTERSASAREYHSMDSRDDQDQRRRRSRQDYAWVFVR